MNKKVYLLMKDEELCADAVNIVIGVFATREDAEEELNSEKSKGSICCVEEWEVKGESNRNQRNLDYDKAYEEAMEEVDKIIKRGDKF